MFDWLWVKEQPIAEVETDEDRLAILEARYRADERENDEAYEAVKVYERTHHIPPSVFVRNDAMYRAMNGRGDPVHQALLHVAQLKQAKRSDSLRAFTDQKIRMGLVK